jgi:hypothetical protein
MEKLNNQVRAVAMLRANAEDIAAYRSHFTAVHEVYQNNQEAYIIGEITLEQLKLLSQITGLSLVINRILN